MSLNIQRFLRQLNIKYVELFFWYTFENICKMQDKHRAKITGSGKKLQRLIRELLQ